MSAGAPRVLGLSEYPDGWPTDSEAGRAAYEEFARNQDFFAAHSRTLADRYAGRIVLVYDGGAVEAFDDIESLAARRRALGSVRGEGAFDIALPSGDALALLPSMFAAARAERE